MTKHPKSPEANGLNEQGFASWKLSPGTKGFCKFLEDFAAALERDHVERWKQGQTDPDYEAEARGRVNALREMATLQFGHVLSFYGEPTKDEETDEREAIDQDPPRRVRGRRVDGGKPVGGTPSRGSSSGAA